MKYLTLAVTLLISSSVLSASESIPKDRKIEELVVYKNLVVVRIYPAFNNTQNCQSNSKDWLQLDYNDQTRENTGLLSTLLAAASANKIVGFGIGGCAGQYPEIYRFDVQY